MHMCACVSHVVCYRVRYQVQRNLPTGGKRCYDVVKLFIDTVQRVADNHQFMGDSAIRSSEKKKTTCSSIMNARCCYNNFVQLNSTAYGKSYTLLHARARLCPSLQTFLVRLPFLRRRRKAIGG